MEEINKLIKALYDRYVQETMVYSFPVHDHEAWRAIDNFGVIALPVLFQYQDNWTAAMMISKIFRPVVQFYLPDREGSINTEIERWYKMQDPKEIEKRRRLIRKLGNESGLEAVIHLGAEKSYSKLSNLKTDLWKPLIRDFSLPKEMRKN